MPHSHTPEPWYVLEKNAHAVGHNTGTTPQVVAQVFCHQGHTTDGRHLHGSPREEIGDATAASNAKRIVACVNGCAGMNPEAMSDLWMALERLKNIVVQIPDWHVDSEICRRVKAAMTALKAAKEV